MAVEKYGYGIKSIKFGTPTGSNTMPVTLTLWAQTVRGSFTLSEEAAQTKQYKVEEATAPIKETVTDAGALTGKWRAYDLSPALIAVVKGGVATTPAAPTAHTYDGPVSVVPLELALEVVTTNNITINIYKASVLARFDGSLSAEDLLQIEVTAKALDPGNGTSPYQFKFLNPS